jgi:hypothetical protein
MAPLHVPAHTPLTHELPAQTFPHLPQLSGSRDVITHPSVPQHVSPTAQLHVGLEHAVPSGVAVQHWPCTHDCPALVLHARPQPPQLFGSVVGSMHAAPQHVWPKTHPDVAHDCAGSWQALATHDHPCGQMMLQPPQLFGLLVVSVHTSWQQLSKFVQVGFAHGVSSGRHFPPKQVMPSLHTTPHPPQFDGSSLEIGVHPSFVPESGVVFVPPSSTTHMSVAGLHVVPAGQAWFAHD